LKIGGRLAGNRRVGVWGGAELSPFSMEDWGLDPRENFEIYVNADANLSLTKVKFMTFSQYT